MQLAQVLRVPFTTVVSAVLAAAGTVAQSIRVNAPLPREPRSGDVWDDVIELEWGRDASRLLYTATDRTSSRLPSLDVYSADLSRLAVDGLIPVVRLGTGGGIEVSPAGGWVAFAMGDPCELFPCTAWLRAAPIDGSAPERILRQLTGTLLEYRFTADGAHLVHLTEFVWPDAGYYSRALSSVPSDGSSAAVILSVPQGGTDPGPFVGHFANAANRRVVFTEAHDGIPHVYSVPVDGGAPVALEPPGLGPGASLRELQLTPDGRTVVFVAYVPEHVMYELFAAPSDGSGPAARLGPPAAPGSNLAAGFELDSLGKRAVFVRDRELWSTPVNLARGMVAVRLSAKPVPGGGVALEGFEQRAQFTLAPDASRAVYRAEQDALGRFELFSVPMDGSAIPARLHPPLAGQQDVAPDAFAIGAGRVVFVADLVVPGMPELFAAPLDGVEPPVRLSAPFPAGGGLRAPTANLRDAFALSPDGLTVAYLADQRTAGTIELFAVPSDGSRAPRRLNRELVPGGDVCLSLVREPFVFSPDGSLVAYLADQDVDEIVELFVSWIDPPHARRAPWPLR